MASRLAALSSLLGTSTGLGQSFHANKPSLHVRRGDNQQLYCPSGHGDYNTDYGDNVEINANGWTLNGGGRVSSKTSFNLLGGYVEFDMDTTKTNAAVNTNVYTTSPAEPNCGSTCYCDIQKSPTGKPSCMEMDIIEANGNCAMATTIHTFANDAAGSPDCDRGGCASIAMLPGSQFHIRAEFDLNGTTTIFLNGVPNDQYQPTPSSDSNAVVVKTMQSVGAVIESSQWFGWVPASDKCPGGDPTGLDASVLTVSNVKVSGVVVQGPTPTLC